MASKYNVLVFPCGSEIGLEIKNALQYSSHFNLLGAGSVKDHGVYNYDTVLHLPHINDENFINELNDLISSHNIHFLYPAHDAVIYKLSRYHQFIKCSIIGSIPETIEICRFKSKTYEQLRNIIKVPISYNKQNVTTFPVFLKPDAGNGSKGVALARSQSDLDFYLSENVKDNMLILEYLPGKEYTVDCFTNSKGNLLFAAGRTRNSIINGISVNTFLSKEYQQEFFDIAAKINTKLKMKGAWFFQVKQNKANELTLLEIAPRIAGSMALFRNAGVNFPLLSLFDTLGYDVRINYQDFSLELDRSLSNKFISGLNYKTVYVDLDDCLIINNKINTQLIKFLYQCINNNIGLNLITRHRDILEQTFTKFRINNLFDNIYLLKEGEKKSDFIKNDASIFIDDSFSERDEVRSQKNIPVFSPDAIECLIK